MCAQISPSLNGYSHCAAFRFGRVRFFATLRQKVRKEDFGQNSILTRLQNCFYTNSCRVLRKLKRNLQKAHVFLSVSKRFRIETSRRGENSPARRPNPNASVTSRSARQRLSEAGDFLEEGGEYYDAIAGSNNDSFESAATGNSSIVSDPDPDM